MVLILNPLFAAGRTEYQVSKEPLNHAGLGPSSCRWKCVGQIFIWTGKAAVVGGFQHYKCSSVAHTRLAYGCFHHSGYFSVTCAVAAGDFCTVQLSGLSWPLPILLFRKDKESHNWPKDIVLFTGEFVKQEKMRPKNIAWPWDWFFCNASPKQERHDVHRYSQPQL